MRPLSFIDICACIGGFTLGLEAAGMICKGQIEIDEYRNKILSKHWPHVPKWRDVKTVDPASLPAVDLICGGYPCQPFSLTGKRAGKEDDRHLWPFIRTIIAHKQPSWCLFENVAGHVTMGLDEVLSDMETLGYATAPLIIPACAVDTVHRRDRVWILANSPGNQLQGRTVGAAERFIKPAHKQLAGFLLTGARASISLARTYRSGHGVPNMAHRNSALGNAVVPQLVCRIGQAITAAHCEERG